MNGFYKLKDKLIKNKLYICVWLIALFTVIFFNTLSNKAHTFMGVTTSKETNINLDHAVVIQSVNVLSGQYIKKGDLLAVLKRPDLTIRINETNRKIDEISAQLNLNKNLTNSLKSVKRDSAKLNDDDLISIQLKNAEQELAGLLKEQEELYIFSKFDGYIGSINFKNGESVSPFQPILTIYSKTPTMVQGLIHESLSHKVLKDTKVIVKNLNGDKTVKSTVFSVGKRIIELPERFKKNASDVAWGREVMVKMPMENSFLLGEKVFLELHRNEKEIHLLNSAVADVKVKLNEPKGTIFMPMTLPDNILDDHLIEPSGLTYIKELEKFMMISDDTKDNVPYVYLVDKEGSIESHVMTVANLKKINDVEAISEDSKGNIYMISSQSKNKKDKVTNSRKLFVKITRSGVSLNAVSEVKLFDKILDIVRSNPELEISRLLKGKKEKLALNVEGLVVKNNAAYLGLREPVGQNRNLLIVKIDDIESLFANEKLTKDRVSIWAKLDLPVKRKEDRNEGISGLSYVGDKLYILTANNNKKDRGRLLVTSFKDPKVLKEIFLFDEFRPEGLSVDGQEKKAYVVFDKNSRKGPFKMAVVDLREK